MWRDDVGNESDWLCDVIVVHNPVRRQSSYFPCQRWLRTGEVLTLYDRNTFLPQCDPEPEKRRQELERKRREYPLEKLYQLAMVSHILFYYTEDAVKFMFVKIFYSVVSIFYKILLVNLQHI